MKASRGLFEPDAAWRSEAACATPLNKELYFTERDIWFHPNPEDPDYDQTLKEENEALAKSICKACPVRDLCLRDALEDQRIDGTRGGLTEVETRKALSVDEYGKEIRRGEFPACPYCEADTSDLIPTKIPLPEGGRWSEAKAVKCSSCGFEWKSRSSHNAVTAYNKEQKKLQDQIKREQITRERLSR